MATTLLCIALAWHLQATRRQRQAVEAIRAAGGWVAYDYAWKDGDWIAGAESPVPRWLTAALGEDAFHSVVAVHLAAMFHSAQSDQGSYYGPDLEATMPQELWHAIADLRSTQWLSLNARNLRDIDLRHLRGLSQLSELKLEAVPIDGSGLAHLVALSNLQHLNLSRVHLKDEHAHWLGQMKQLRVLGLNESTLSPAVAAELQQIMPGCQQYYEHWPPPARTSPSGIEIRLDLPGPDLE